jgi:hypothetical protein
MADDLVLRIQLAVDGVGNVQTAMGQASASVQAGASQIAGNMKQADVAMAEFADNTASAATQVIPPLESIPASLQEVPPVAAQMSGSVTTATTGIGAGFKQATHSGIMGFETVQQRVIDLTKRSAELRTALLSTSDPAQQKALNAELRMAQQHLNASRQELRGLSFEEREATEKAQLLAAQFGVHLPGGVTRLMGRLPLLQSAMEAAFPVLVVTAFLAALREVPDAIAQGTDAIMGFGEEAKKRYEETVQSNLRLLTDNLKLHDSLRGLGTTGLSGLEKLSVEHKNLQENIKETGDLMAVLMRAQISQQAEVDALTSGWRLWGTVATGWVDGTDQRIQKLLTTIKNEQGVISQLETQLRTLREYEPRKLGAETGAEERRLAEARLDARRRVALAELDASKAVLAEQRAANLASGIQEITDLRVLADRKMAIEREYYRERIRLAQSGVDRSRLTAELEAAELAYRATITELNTRQISEERRIASERIAAQEGVTRANLDTEQQWISDALSLRRISVDEATDYQLQVERERYAEARRAMLDQAALEQTDQEALNARLQALEIEHQNKLSAIDAEGERRRIDQATREANLEFSSAAASADRELALRRRHNDERLATHRITLAQYQAQETAALNEWYERQREALVRLLNLIKVAYGEASLEYREMLERMKALDAQRAEELDRLNSQIAESQRRSIREVSGEIKRGLTQWIVGYRSFRDAVIGVYASLVERAVGFILEIGARQIEEWILETVFHQGEKAKQIASTAASAAAETAIVSSQNVGQVTSEAAVAAATAYAAYAWDPPLAEAMAAEAFAATMAWAPVAAFEQGGIMPKTDLALLHKNEMVLPANLSATIQTLAAQGGSPSSVGGTVHVHYAPDVHAFDRRGVAEVLQEHSEVLSGIIRKEMRRGRIPSP